PTSAAGPTSWVRVVPLGGMPPDAQPCAATEMVPEVAPAEAPRTRATALRCPAAGRALVLPPPP
ncbi:hypothetical protein, partial [Nocardia brasiliensis]|uniref:hypothetical protein n=1 Tax=Nocardia brasiliensis TaxID=37326 RepID=UPI00245695CA